VLKIGVMVLLALAVVARTGFRSRSVGRTAKVKR
jgi:hypothetical protein